MSAQRLFYLFKICSVVLLATALLSACQSSASKEHSVKNTEAEAVDFPYKVQADYAEGFRISYHKNYKLLEILKPFQDKVDTLRYSLVPRELEEEVKVENTEEILIPVRSLIATSTTHIALTDMLDANEVIKAVVTPNLVYSKEIRKRIEGGAIAGFPQGRLNKEKVLALNPDLLMISGGQSSQFDNYQVLMDSGIALLVNSEWLETTPLGKAEWMKVVAALLDKEQQANEKFDAVTKQYVELKAAVDTVEQKPLVVNNFPYKDAWFVSGGKSFTARFLKDAGADYPWYDSEESGGLRKDFEAVYEQGLKADIWLNPGSATTKEEVLAKDERFKDFKAFQTDEIYNSYRRSTESGGNDYWESGVVHPEIVLADMIKILHPEIVPDHNLYYYHKVE